MLPEFRIERDIAAMIREKSELYLTRSRPAQVRIVKCAAVGRRQCRVHHALSVLVSRCVRDGSPCEGF
jgi:hypothetical protein